MFLELFKSWKTYYVSALKLVVFPMIIVAITFFIAGLVAILLAKMPTKDILQHFSNKPVLNLVFEKIIELLNHCNDISLLSLILKLLQKS